jgi:diaminopimelate decarboxylase
MKIQFHDKKSFFEDVCINDLIKSIPTPFYLYSQKTITETYDYLNKSLASEIFFSVKANSNQAILKLIKNCGAGADVVSIGELQRALQAGFDPKNIIFEGVGKSKEDIKFCIQKKIRLINTESINEIILINQIGKEIGKKINIGVRLNPNIDGNTLDKISTGKKTDKFGISINKLQEIINKIKSLPNINLKGISCHIGSQIYDVNTYKKVFLTMQDAAEKIRSLGIDLQYVDLGGGFGVNYDADKNKIDISSIGKLVRSIFYKSPYDISFEPGRYLVAKAGILITKILTTKENGGINFLITDAGMQTLIRPAMYGASHRLEALNDLSEKNIKYTVAGPICESSDIIAKNISLPEQKVNNYLGILDTGAYGAVMASNYNSRGIPSEVLVNKNKFFVIHQEENILDIIKRDSVPDWL